jgi:hypothetical protein
MPPHLPRRPRPDSDGLYDADNDSFAGQPAKLSFFCLHGAPHNLAPRGGIAQMKLRGQTTQTEISARAAS